MGHSIEIHVHLRLGDALLRVVADQRQQRAEGQRCISRWMVCGPPSAASFSWILSSALPRFSLSAALVLKKPPLTDGLDLADGLLGQRQRGFQVQVDAEVFMPRRASSSDVARPKPLDAPRIKAQRPVSSIRGSFDAPCYREIIQRLGKSPGVQ